jgi:hypothetical protein
MDEAKHQIVPHKHMSLWFDDCKGGKDINTKHAENKRQINQTTSPSANLSVSEVYPFHWSHFAYHSSVCLLG